MLCFKFVRDCILFQDYKLYFELNKTWVAAAAKSLIATTIYSTQNGETTEASPPGFGS